MSSVHCPGRLHGIAQRVPRGGLRGSSLKRDTRPVENCYQKRACYLTCAELSTKIIKNY